MHPRLAHMLIKAKELGAIALSGVRHRRRAERARYPARSGQRPRRADLRLRIAALRGDVRDLPPGVIVDQRAKTQALRASSNWQRDFGRGGKDKLDLHTATGVLLACAYPDRIAKARGETGRYVMANGRGARFGEPQALAKSEFIVAAELDGAEREARIFWPPRSRKTDLEKYFGELIEEYAETRWDERSQAVLAQRERRIGSRGVGIHRYSQRQIPMPQRQPQSAGSDYWESTACRGARICVSGARASR